MPTLSGNYHVWRLGQHCRRYATVTMPLVDAVALFETKLFNARTRTGEQRKTTPAHVRTLRAEITEGRFTPTAWACTIPKPLQGKIVYDHENQRFSVEVPAKKTLPCTDGGHRRDALLMILKELNDSRKMAQDEDTQRKYDALIRDVEQLPISIEIQLDGDSRVDFLNLNKGKVVPRTLVFSMEVATEQFDDPHYRRAYALAHLLHTDNSSPFFGVIKSDDRWEGASPIPVSTLCSGRTSDKGTSLIGLACIGEAFDMSDQTLSRTLCTAFSALRNRCASILHFGYPLTPPMHGGKLGSSTLLVGVGITLSYAMGLEALSIPSESLLTRLAEAASAVFGEPTGGDLGGPRKRQLMGDFAEEFFRDTDVLKHEGIPARLCALLSAGTYARGRMTRTEIELALEAPARPSDEMGAEDTTLDTEEAVA